MEHEESSLMEKLLVYSVNLMPSCVFTSPDKYAASSRSAKCLCTCAVHVNVLRLHADGAVNKRRIILLLLSHCVVFF